MYTMKIQLLPDEVQREELVNVMKRFNEACNFISEIGFKTKTNRNKIKLHKECYNFVRDSFNFPSQMVVRAIGKVVEAYKQGAKTPLRFGETTSVVYDSRLLAFKWLQRVSIATLSGRIEVPFKVTGYRHGSYGRRVTGQADLIYEKNEFYLLLLIDLPEISDISSMEFAGVGS